MSEPVTPPVSTGPAGPIVARAGRYYRNARYLMVLGLLVMAGFFLYDGYKRYPAQNEKIDEIAREIDKLPKGSPTWVELDQQRQKLGAKKSDTDIGLQKVLGYVLPVVGLAYLLYFLNKSRGEVRLENDILTAPGHPPVPLSAIESIDSRLWKKKGIATVKYTVAGKSGAIMLDDFVYQQTPIDAIYDRLVPPAASAPTSDNEPQMNADERG